MSSILCEFTTSLKLGDLVSQEVGLLKVGSIIFCDVTMGQHNKLTTILPISNKHLMNLWHVVPPQSVVLSPQYSQFLGEALKVFLKILDDGEPQFIAEQNMQVSWILSVCLSVSLSLSLSLLLWICKTTYFAK